MFINMRPIYKKVLCYSWYKRSGDMSWLSQFPFFVHIGLEIRLDKTRKSINLINYYLKRRYFDR